MAGVKGRSGRKSHYDEMSIIEVVNKSIKTVNDYLSDENIALEKRVGVAKDFALKHMPQQVKGEGFNDMIIINNIKKVIEDAYNIRPDRITSE